MKISSKLIAICLFLGAEKAVQATELSSDAIAEIMSFNNIAMKVDPTQPPQEEALENVKTNAKETAEAEAIVNDNQVNSATPVMVPTAPVARPTPVVKRKVVRTPQPVVLPPPPMKVTRPSKGGTTPVPAEAAAPGAKVVEEKQKVETVEEANEKPIEEIKAPGEEEAESKPQPKGDATQLKPKTVVVQEANGEKVVTVPDAKIRPVPVEKAEPVVLKRDVDLGDKGLESQLNIQNKVKTIENKKAQEARDVTKAASVASAGDVAGIQETNKDYRSGMTLYHWNMFDQESQLQMYKASVYRGNMLEDQTQKAKVAIKLTEEETTKVQATLAKKLAQIRQLADEVIGNIDTNGMEPQELEALDELKKRGFTNKEMTSDLQSHATM